MFDPLVTAMMVGGLVLMGLILISLHSSRRVKDLSLGNIVMAENKPPVSKYWSGSSFSKSYDDKGSLKVDKDGITFSGSKTITISKSAIKSISSFRSKSPWFILASIDLILLGILVYSITNQVFLILPLVMIFVVLNGVFLVFGTGTEWIEIGYEEHNNPKKLFLGAGYSRYLQFFAPGTSGAGGENYEIYRKIKNIFN